MHIYFMKRKQLYIQRNIFEILWNHTEIRLYLPFSNWFGTDRTSGRFQINRCMVNTIWFQFDLTIFLCVYGVLTTKEVQTCKTWEGGSFGPTPFFYTFEIFLNDILTKICFLDILTKPKACITHSSAIL